VGELIVRPDRPWTTNLGYHGLPEESLTAWRNGWYHTGDNFRVDSAGFYTFADRKKDMIAAEAVTLLYASCSSTCAFDLERERFTPRRRIMSFFRSANV